MSKLANFINRHITHNRDNEGDFGSRMLLHIPIGLLIGIPVLGDNLGKLFKAYEENEDIHTKDEAWKDYFGAIVGCSITVVVIIIIIAVIVWRIING